MTLLQQLFQWSITILFIAVLLLLFTALIRLHMQTFIEWRQRRAEAKQESDTPASLED